MVQKKLSSFVDNLTDDVFIDFISRPSSAAKTVFRENFLKTLKKFFGDAYVSREKVNVFELDIPYELKKRLRDNGVLELYLQEGPIFCNSLNGYLVIKMSDDKEVSSTEEVTLDINMGDGKRKIGFDTLHIHDDEIYGERIVSSKVPIEAYVEDIIIRTIRFGCEFTLNEITLNEISE